MRRNQRRENVYFVRKTIGLITVLAKIQRRRGKHSLLHASFVLTVGLQATEPVIVRAEDVTHAKEDITLVYATEGRIRIWYCMHTPTTKKHFHPLFL